MTDHAYKITDWDSRYECNKDGRAYKPGSERRAGALDYIRSKCQGHRQSSGYRHMLHLAGDRGAEVFGVFCKIKEFAGMVDADKRDGTVYNEHGEPATVKDMAWMSGFTEEAIGFALEVLCQQDVSWISRFSLNSASPFEPEEALAEISEPRGNQRASLNSANPFEPENALAKKKQPENALAEKRLKSSQIKSNQNKSISRLADASTEPDAAQVEVEVDLTWLAAKTAILRAYPSNRTVQKLITWVGNKIMKQPSREQEVVEVLWEMMQTARNKDSPPAYFVTIAKDRLGYRPNR